MKWFSGSNVRTVVMSGGIAAVTALAVAGVPALAQGSAPAASTPPVIVAGVGHHTVFLNSTTPVATVGKLRLTSGGWTIFGKAEVQVGSNVELHCSLTAGTDRDLVSPQIDTSVFDQEVVLNVSHVFRSTGTVSFSCNGSGVSVAIFNVKMTAFRAGTLRRVNL